jgi:hypothetical protein
MKQSHLVFLGLAVITSGCMDINSDTFPGKYTGTWTKDGSQDQVALSATLSMSADQSDAMVADIACTDSKSPCTFHVEVQKTKKTRAALQMTGNQSIDTDLNWNKHDDRTCLSDGANELCLLGSRIVLSFTDANNVRNVLTFNKEGNTAAAASDVNTVHASKSYKLSELLNVASHMDFSSRIEYQRYLESRYTAKATALALLPHVNINTVSSILADFNVGGFLNMVGDLVPFLLPSRWAQKNETKYTAKAEYESAVIIHLNAILYAEQMSYAYLRDKKGIETLAKQRASVLSIYNELVVRESVGQMPTGSSQDIASILNAIDQATLSMQQTLDVDLQALALASGMSDPKAIQTVVNDSARDISKPELITEDQLENLAIQNGHEIEQANYLYEVSRASKVERAWNFLDPTNYTPTQSIGASMFPVAKMGTAQIEEFRLLQEQIETQIKSKAAGLYTNLQFVLQNQVLVEQATKIQTIRVKRILNQLSFGTNFVLADLVNALQDQVSAQVGLVGNEALYQATEAQIDRLILRGTYHEYNETVN